MKSKLIAVFAIAGILFASCSNQMNKNTEQTPENSTQTLAIESTEVVTEKLPDLTLTAADGSTINLASLKGKKVFVNLWATWCPPCIAEIPSIEKLYSKVDKENNAFVMLSLDENFELAKNYAKTNNMTLPVFYPSAELPDIFQVQGIPATFIFNENGELIKVNNGMDNYDTDEYVQLLKANK